MARDIRTGRAFDRMINFSDAVVAIAITLQVLPLADIAGPTGTETVWDVMGDNSAQIVSFVVTFMVVGVMWTVHNRLVNRLVGYDGTMLWLNLYWILAIAFLPWPAAMYGEANSGSASEQQASSGEGFAGTGMLYWGTLALISLLSWLMGMHIERHPELVEPAYRARWAQSNRGRARLRGPAFVASFIVLGVLSELIPNIAVWLPFALIPIGFLVRDGKDVDADLDDDSDDSVPIQQEHNDEQS